jgi:glycine/D-amino acid oxidase-like deaminating enzyme
LITGTLLFAAGEHSILGAGLGGFGMMTSAAVGELAADMLLGRSPDWVDMALTAPARFHS